MFDISQPYLLYRSINILYIQFSLQLEQNMEKYADNLISICWKYFEWYSVIILLEKDQDTYST